MRKGERSEFILATIVKLTHYRFVNRRLFQDHSIIPPGQAGLYEARGGARTHFVAPIIPEIDDEAAEQWPQTLPSEIGEVRGELSQPRPELQMQVDQIDPIERLRRILIEKVKDVPATDLQTIREYIKEIRELGSEKENKGQK